MAIVIRVNFALEEGGERRGKRREDNADAERVRGLNGIVYNQDNTSIYLTAWISNSQL